MESQLSPEYGEEPELVYLIADALRRTGRPAEALRLAGAVEPRARRSGDRRLLLRCVNLTGMASFETGAMADSEGCFSEMLNLSGEWEDFEFAARACNNLGVLGYLRGRIDLALTYYQRALASYDRMGYVRGLAQTHYNLGMAYRELYRFDEADSHYRNAIRLAEQSGSEDVTALAESDRGLLFVDMGDPQLGGAFAQRARERFQRIGDPVREAEAMRVLALAAQASGGIADALDLFDQALQVARAHSNPLLHGDVQRDRAIALAAAGRGDESQAALAEAAEQFQGMGATALAERVEALRARFASPDVNAESRLPT